MTSLRAFGSEKTNLGFTCGNSEPLWNAATVVSRAVTVLALTSRVFKALRKLHKVTLRDTSAVKDGQPQELIFLPRSANSTHCVNSVYFFFVHL